MAVNLSEAIFYSARNMDTIMRYHGSLLSSTLSFVCVLAFLHASNLQVAMAQYDYFGDGAGNPRARNSYRPPGYNQKRMQQLPGQIFQSRQAQSGWGGVAEAAKNAQIEIQNATRNNRYGGNNWNNNWNRNDNNRNNNNSRNNYNHYPQNQRQPNYQRSYQPRQQTYQPAQPRVNYNSVPQQSSVPTIVNSIPSISKPTPAAIPTNNLPSAKVLQLTESPLENGDPISGIDNLPLDLLNPLTGHLHGQTREDFESALEAFNEATNITIEVLLDDFTDRLGLPEDAKQALRERLHEGDIAGAKDIIAEAGLAPKSLLEAAEKLDDFGEVGQMMDDFEEALASGESFEDIKPLIDDLRSRLDPMEPNGEGPVVDLMASLDDIEIDLRIEEALNEGPSDEPMHWQDDCYREVLVVYEPDLDQQQVFFASSDLIVLPSPRGEFHTAAMPIIEALNLPIGQDDPAPAAENEDLIYSSGIVIRNPESNGAAISYQINGKNYTSEPGETQVIEAASKRVIKFDNGNEKTKAYTIRPGTFDFVLTDTEWKFFNKSKSSFELTLNNKQRSTPFHFVIDGERKSIAAGESDTYTSKYPMLVSFDRGNNANTAHRRLDQGEFTVAIDRDSNHWDLFASTHLSGRKEGQASADEQRPRSGSRSKRRWKKSS